MTATQLIAQRDERPFVPFRLVMSDGRHYDIRHPELLFVGRTASMVGVADKDEGYVLADHFIRVVNDHITTTIPLSVADQVGT